MAGSATVPNILALLAGGNQPVSLIDDDFTAILNYINGREITTGLLAARPVAGTSGRLFFATDDNGGTLYLDTGAAWVQLSFPVGAVGQTSLFFAIPLWLPQA